MKRYTIFLSIQNQNKTYIRDNWKNMDTGITLGKYYHLRCPKHLQKGIWILGLIKSGSGSKRDPFPYFYYHRIYVLQVYHVNCDIDFLGSYFYNKNVILITGECCWIFYDKFLLLFLFILPIWYFIDSLMNSDLFISSSMIVSIKFLYCCSVILIVTDFFLFFFISIIISSLVILGGSSFYFLSSIQF